MKGKGPHHLWSIRIASFFWAADHTNCIRWWKWPHRQVLLKSPTFSSLTPMMYVYPFPKVLWGNYQGYCHLLVHKPTIVAESIAFHIPKRLAHHGPTWFSFRHRIMCRAAHPQDHTHVVWTVHPGNYREWGWENKEALLTIGPNLHPEPGSCSISPRTICTALLLKNNSRKK